jgi:hypothetical protein
MNEWLTMLSYNTKYHHTLIRFLKQGTERTPKGSHITSIAKAWRKHSDSMEIA